MGKAKKNLKKLTDGMLALEDKRHDIQMELDRGFRKEERQRSYEVRRWLREVDYTDGAVRAIQSEYERRRSSGILGIPNYVGIYLIGNRAAKLLEKVMELEQTYLEISLFLEEEKKRTRMIESCLDEVCGHLEEEEGEVVGIVGTCGTTVLEAMRNRYLNGTGTGTSKVLFDHVIFIEFSQEHGSENLHKDIANSLGLDLGYFYYTQQAAIIFDFLKEKNFLLLLDGLREEVDLRAIRIPDPYTRNRRWRRKVVFTTQYGEVCDFMYPHKKIIMDLSNRSVNEVITSSTRWSPQSSTTTPAGMESPTDTSGPDMTSSSVINTRLVHGNKDNNRRKDLELKKIQVTSLEPNFHNEYNEESRGQRYQTTSEEEQTKSSHGSQISNFREEWLRLEVPYADIKDATNGLSKSSEIGRGGYGTVYKGKLGGTTVAIKMLDSTSKQGKKEFVQELEVLSQMRHPNLVKLVGACFEVNALVYEFLPNGSLEDCLNYSPYILTWQMRTRIIHEICSALICLHSKSVVHGDLKPANILLDANFKSKLSDFGLCRLLPEEMTTALYLETVPKGTSGYVDPWFLETGILRPGSDLYSFGITILKLLTGKPPIGLGVIARDADENSFRQMIDSTAGSWHFGFAKELLYWSLQCCYNNNKSSRLLADISTCLEEMLAEIETFQQRFKVVLRRKRVAEDSLNAEENNEEEMQEEHVVIAVVLKVHMHCEDCAQEIRKRILRMKGVESVEPETKTSQVIVKGVFDPPELVEYVHHTTGGTHVTIVKVQPGAKKPEEEKAKDEKNEGNAEEVVELLPEEPKNEQKSNEFYYHPEYAAANGGRASARQMGEVPLT